MTLIAALEAQDGLVLASDTRGTIGDPRGLTAINDVQQKIFRLSDYCGISVSGASELANSLIDSFMVELEAKKLIDIDPIVSEFFEWGRAMFRKWFGAKSFFAQGNLQDQRPVINFIMAGFNKNGNSKGRIYLLNSMFDFVPQLCTTGHMLAGVPQYAIYLMHRLYNPQMRLENIKNLAAYLIQETATQDPKVGGPIKMAEITLDNGFRELEAGVISEIIKKNDEQNVKLRKFFFSGSEENV